MKRFFSFVYKELIHIMRDPRTLLVLLIMPVVQMIIFGFALSTEINNVRFAVLDPSKDSATERIIEQLQSSSYFTLVGEISHQEEISDLFEKEKIDIAVVFSQDFYRSARRDGSASVQLISDGSNTNVATMGVFYASNIISSMQRELFENQVLESGMGEERVQIIPNYRMLYNPSMKSAFTFVPGVMGMILMLICALMTSVAIVREKERGTMELLLVSPVNPFLVIVAKAVPYMGVSIINLITIILMSVYLLGVPISGSMWGLFLVSLLFILVSLSLGILISTIAKHQSVAMIVSAMVLMLPTMLLSGMLFPIESMPKFLQVLTAGVPARWYIYSVKTIMIEGLALKFCLKEIGILFGFLVLFLTASLLNYKTRL